jgi:hypothetical protein
MGAIQVGSGIRSLGGSWLFYGNTKSNGGADAFPHRVLKVRARLLTEWVGSTAALVVHPAS